MNRISALLAITALLALPTPALACATAIDPLLLVIASASFATPFATTAAQGILHALSGRSRRAAVWARRFGWLNLALAAGWFGLLFVAGAPPHLAWMTPGLVLLVVGLCGAYRRRSAAPRLYSTSV